MSRFPRLSLVIALLVMPWSAIRPVRIAHRARLEARMAGAMDRIRHLASKMPAIESELDRLETKS